MFTVGLSIAAVVALADQFSKHWLLGIMGNAPHAVTVAPFLNLVLNWNKGVTFGLFNHAHVWLPYALITIAAIILCILFQWLNRVNSLTLASGVGLIIGGAVGNVIDRVRFGAVVDFLDFHIHGYHWYTFNVADSAIVCGVGLILLDNLIRCKKRE